MPRVTQTDTPAPPSAANGWLRRFSSLEWRLLAPIPIIFVMRRLPASRIPAVTPDNHRGGFLAAEHLIDKGHRRLAFLGGFDDMVGSFIVSGSCS